MRRGTRRRRRLASVPTSPLSARTDRGRGFELFLAHGYHGTSIDATTATLEVLKQDRSSERELALRSIVDAFGRRGSRRTRRESGRADDEILLPVGDDRRRKRTVSYRLLERNVQAPRNRSQGDGVRAGHVAVDDPLVATRAITGMILHVDVGPPARLERRRRTGETDDPHCGANASRQRRGDRATRTIGARP